MTDDRTEEALASESFRLLNHMIDERARSLAEIDALFQDRARKILAAEPEAGIEVRTRTYEEVTRGAELPRILDIVDAVGSIAHFATVRTQILEEIRQLQVAKLKILGDWDFCKGDLTLQTLVLGAPNPEA